MKKIITPVLCLFMLSTSFAQKAVSPRKNPAMDVKKLLAAKRCLVTGTLKDTHNLPLRNVEAFIYQADGVIVASGFTGEDGHYETNSVLPGTYNVKLVFPSKKAILITGVILKPGITPVSVKAEPPVEDTPMAYSDIKPKTAEPKKKAK